MPGLCELRNTDDKFVLLKSVVKGKIRIKEFSRKVGKKRKYNGSKMCVDNQSCQKVRCIIIL